MVPVQQMQLKTKSTQHEQLLKNATEEEKFAKLEKFPISPKDHGMGNGEWQQSQETEAASSAE